MGDYEDFRFDAPDGGGDDEFAKVLWESLPENVRTKFEDRDQIDMFLRKVDLSLKKCGLIMKQVGIGVDPINGEAILSLQTAFSEKEEAFQSNKELAEMMWDAQEDRVASVLKDLQKAAESGDSRELGLQ